MLALAKGIREPREVKKKILLTSVGIKPMTSGLGKKRSTVTLPTEPRGRTEKVGDDKVRNCGKEKVRVHMNVVPCSTMNTNGGTEN